MDTYNPNIELPQEDTLYFKQVEDVISVDTHHYRCTDCNKGKTVVNTGESAQINVELSKVMTGLNHPASSSELGTRDMALNHNSEFRSRALKVEAELDTRLQKEQLQKMKDQVFKSKCNQEKGLTYPIMPYSKELMEELKAGFRTENDGLSEQLNVLNEINESMQQ